MKRKAFTLVELLVVIAIIALLMGILMPALARVRQIAYRMLCGSNLAGIGKAMLIYSNDYDEEYPKAGSPGSRWTPSGRLDNWDSQEPGMQWGMANRVTITSSLYLLIKYADVTPKQFVCKGDVGTKIFQFSDSTATMTNIEDITDFWDFGDGQDTAAWPGMYCSYSYHMPYNKGTLPGYPITAVSSPASPLCADRNPYLDKNAMVFLEGSMGCQGGEEDEKPPEWVEGGGGIAGLYADVDKTGNSAAHQREGQNVLFNDQHVSFERYPNCGIARDNIWKMWVGPEGEVPKTARERELGDSPYCGILTDQGNPDFGPKAEKDAVLVGECNQENCPGTQ